MHIDFAKCSLANFIFSLPFRITTGDAKLHECYRDMTNAVSHRQAKGNENELFVTIHFCKSK